MVNNNPIISKKLFNKLIEAGLIEIRDHFIQKEDTVKNIYQLGSNPNLTKTELPFSLNGSGELLVINVCDLAHSCKVWGNTLYKEKPIDCFSIESSETWLGGVTAGYANVQNSSDTIIYEAPYCITEYEAIFKAAEWILENKVEN